MKIIKLYKTSLGYFKTKEVALLKKNRVKINDYRDMDCGKREEPEEFLALFDETTQKYFFLNEIKIGG